MGLNLTTIDEPHPVHTMKLKIVFTPTPLAFQIKKGVEYAPFSYYSRSVLRINVTETANYTCYAINQMVTRQSYDQSSFMVYLKEEEEDKAGLDLGVNGDYSKGYCAPYNGQVCRNYLKGRGLVWFNVSQDNSGGWLNEQITEKLWSEIIDKLEEPCRSAAEVILTELLLVVNPNS